MGEKFFFVGKYISVRISLRYGQRYINKTILTKFGYMSRTTLGKQIKALRTKMNLSQEKLAQRAGMPFSTLTKIESGNTPNPSIDTVMKITVALGVGLDELMNRKDG